MTTRRDFSLMLLATGALAACASEPAAAPMRDLTFDPDRFVPKVFTVDGRRIAVRAYEGLPVVARPVEPACQAINVYIPEAYFRGEAVGRYTARTAPIFLPNQVGGYMPALPGRPDERMGPPPAPGTSAPPSAMAVALARGFVVASPGARGRTLRAADGRWTGKAPAAIVDLKAAVRWLRHNAGRLPGDTERIVSNGTSAGGALSALLGASGNSADFEAELQAIGAAPARDDIFAVSAYCPITNLEHADAAYEWQFQGLAEYRSIAISMLDFKVERKEVAGRLDADQLALSRELQAAFIAYVNGLGLHDGAGRLLQLDASGRGSLRDHVSALLAASAQRALDRGDDLSGRPWLSIESGRVQGVDFTAYAAAAGRMKALPAFDGLALETGENQLFGDARTDQRHFTAFSVRHGRAAGAARADALTVRQMNAMHYASDPSARAAPHWRLRHGTMDRDTSLAIPALLAAALRERGLDVDLALPWDRPHSGDYDLDELFGWIERLM
ncbi:alpha/beta hydrolase family protein [Sphaerotilus hippei]|uniref:Alpha/beta hydrolase family protein n=1 Tax=Sphaerotilus hippei TaxID=744406 RepID=A0A318GYL7_9BURK|nr:subtype B tannase [Sphaerotilus hippei]PXW92283.1 alpha/beta hydrolase family protein [Sphaerotilus hippei]